MLEQNVKICNMCIATTGISRHFYFNFLSNNSCFKPYLILGPFFSIKNTHSLNINLSVDKINNFKDQIHFFHKTKQIVFETQIQKKKNNNFNELLEKATGKCRRHNMHKFF